MDLAILADTISNILPWTSFLKPLANRLSGIDINQLENHLREIGDKVKKAKQSQSHSQGSDVLQWLQKVKEVIIDLNDLMEDLRHKESTTNTKSLFRSGLNIKYRVKATLQVKKAAEELKRLSDEAQRLSFSFSEEVARKNERKLADYKQLEETVVTIGRENEKKDIIDQLLNGAAPVVAIVGVPGIGKTKLADLVCRDEEVKAHFDSLVWVSFPHNVESIAKSVTESTTSDGKPYLLVLDDLRLENIGGEYLENLQQALTEPGRTGGATLITTRSNLLANKIAARFVLQGLNQQESRSLFQQIRGPASANSSSNIELDQMVRDCGGVPLAIVILATLLKRLEAEQVAEVEKVFVQELKLIYYDDLLTHQKLCFAYCSLFPRDYLIDAERLIQLWMAEGFFSTISSENPEEFGRACFEDFIPLVFQKVEEEEEKNDQWGVERKYYRTNRLMHELARVVASDENITVDSEGERVHDGMLRASFDFALDLSCGIPDSVFEKAKKLRSILLPSNTNNPRLPHEVKMTTSTCDKIFNTFKSLRVLDLHDLGIKMIPSSIEEMKYLRYLDLSHNNIEKLPSCITKLIHLQTLKLSQCHVLKELPKDLEDLSCLRHLDIEGCLDLTHMPRGINKLTSLQTLSLFVASKKHVTGGLRELADLNNLRGHLEILHLEQLKFSPSKEPAKDKFLINKEHLRSLTLRWDHDEEEEEEEEEVEIDVDDKDKKSLDCLEPNPNLRVLLIVGYNGHTFSNWLLSLQCLVEFSLNDCPKCQLLPPLDQLPFLKVLQIRRLDSLEFIAKNSEGSTPIFFPSLKELTITDCPKLRSWWENEIWENNRPFFKCISKLSVQYCPKLTCMPLYPYLDEELVLVASNVRSMRDTMHAETETESESETSTSEAFLPLSKLKSMIIERIEQSPPESWLKNFISLQELHIRDCYHLLSLPQGFKSLSSLQCLIIERCPELDLDDSSKTELWEDLKNLRSLTLRDIPKLKSLPWGVENATSLQDLWLYDCPGLTSLPETIGNLTSLGKLVISECRSLDSLPKGMQKLKSLHTLVITDCPLLLPRCQPDTGDDWPQIAHIKYKHILDGFSREMSYASSF